MEVPDTSPSVRMRVTSRDLSPPHNNCYYLMGESSVEGHTVDSNFTNPSSANIVNVIILYIVLSSFRLNQTTVYILVFYVAV